MKAIPSRLVRKGADPAPRSKFVSSTLAELQEEYEDGLLDLEEPSVPGALRRRREKKRARIVCARLLTAPSASSASARALRAHHQATRAAAVAANARSHRRAQ